VYQAILDRETMTNVVVGKHSTRQVAHNLMHINQKLSSVFRIEGSWLDMRINLAPLCRPLHADFIQPTHKTPFKRFWPRHIGSHKRECGANVTRVKGLVCGA
jgi:hypothetical protein